MDGNMNVCLLGGVHLDRAGRSGRCHLDREPELSSGRQQNLDAGERRPNPHGSLLQGDITTFSCPSCLMFKFVTWIRVKCCEITVIFGVLPPDRLWASQHRQRVPSHGVQERDGVHELLCAQLEPHPGGLVTEAPWAAGRRPETLLQLLLPGEDERRYHFQICFLFVSYLSLKQCWFSFYRLCSKALLSSFVLSIHDWKSFHVLFSGSCRTCWTLCPLLCLRRCRFWSVCTSDRLSTCCRYDAGQKTPRWRISFSYCRCCSGFHWSTACVFLGEKTLKFSHWNVLVSWSPVMVSNAGF